MENSNIIIEAKKLCKQYINGENQQYVIKNMDIQIFDKDFTVFMGPSGSGKSTLMQVLSGMDRASIGEIYFRNMNFSKYSEEELSEFRKLHCGYVFQQIHLINNMSLMDNVLISGLLVQKNKKNLLERAKKLFNDVGLTEQEWKKYPTQISGGQLGRTGIVRALINNPDIIFADEPTGALDSKSGRAVLDILTKINNEGQSIIMVTHDLKSALRGNRILYLKDGRIIGECILEKYKNDLDLDERKDKLIYFLEEMGW